MKTKLILEKIIIPNKGNSVNGLRVYDNRDLYIYFGGMEDLEKQKSWQPFNKISIEGYDLLNTFLKGSFSKIKSIKEKPHGYIKYKIRLKNLKYDIMVDNKVYSDLPPEILELEQIVNGHLERVD